MRTDTTNRAPDAGALLGLASMEKGIELRYRVGSEDAREPRVREVLVALARRCGRNARELRVLASMNGGPLPLARTTHATDLCAVLEEVPTRALLAECAHREDTATSAYARVRDVGASPILDAALARLADGHVAARREVVALAATCFDRSEEDALAFATR